MHRFASLLIPSLWLAWFAYWWTAARGVKPAIRRESAWSRAAHFVPLGIAGLLLAAPTMPGWLGSLWSRPNGSLFAAGAALVLGGLLFTVWARVVLGGNWSGSVTLKREHEIIRSGPYRWIRHPIYTGLLLAFVGSALARPEWRGGLAVLIVVVALWRKLRLEERWLAELFGPAYSDYKRHSWALLPFVI